MLLNFQLRFRPMILDGSKDDTIRAERKDGKRPKAGEILHLYTGLRQTGAELLLRAPHTRTEDIVIDFRNGPLVRIADVTLDWYERSLLAWRDGFRREGATEGNPAGCFLVMAHFWLIERSKQTVKWPFEGFITHWDYTTRILYRRSSSARWLTCPGLWRRPSTSNRHSPRTFVIGRRFEMTPEQSTPHFCCVRMHRHFWGACTREFFGQPVSII